MRVSVSEAKALLTELVRRAEAGVEVILTRHDRDVARIEAVKAATDRTARRALLDEIRAAGQLKATAGPSASRSQDFLYGEDGLPK